MSNKSEDMSNRACETATSAAMDKMMEYCDSDEAILQQVCGMLDVSPDINPTQVAASGWDHETCSNPRQRRRMVAARLVAPSSTGEPPLIDQYDNLMAALQASWQEAEEQCPASSQ